MNRQLEKETAPVEQVDYTCWQAFFYETKDGRILLKIIQKIKARDMKAGAGYRAFNYKILIMKVFHTFNLYLFIVGFNRFTYRFCFLYRFSSNRFFNFDLFRDLFG